MRPELSALLLPPKRAGLVEPSVCRSQVLAVPGEVTVGETPPVQSVVTARPISTTPPHWPCEVLVLRPRMLSRLVKMIGAVAEPTALSLLPRLTASHDWPVPP